MKSLTRSAAFVGMALAALAMAVDKVALEALLKDPAKYDEKTVTVAGTAAAFRAKVSKKGNAYFTFQLKSKDAASVNVYGRGKLERDLKAGEKVEVTGVFRKEKDMRDFVVKNEIDVSPAKEGAKPGVKILSAE